MRQIWPTPRGGWTITRKRHRNIGHVHLKCIKRNTRWSKGRGRIWTIKERRAALHDKLKNGVVNPDTEREIRNKADNLDRTVPKATEKVPKYTPPGAQANPNQAPTSETQGKRTGGRGENRTPDVPQQANPPLESRINAFKQEVKKVTEDQTVLPRPVVEFFTQHPRKSQTPEQTLEKANQGGQDASPNTRQPDVRIRSSNITPDKYPVIP